MPILRNFNSGRWSGSVLALSAVGAATLLNLILWPGGSHSDGQYFLLITAVLVTALSSGLIAGIVASALAALSSAYFSLLPQFSLGIASADAAKRLGIFLLEALTLSVIAQLIRTSERADHATHRPIAPLGALGSVAAAILLKVVIPRIGEEMPFALNYAAVLVSARLAGLAWGTIATALLVISTRYLFLEPRYSLEVANQSEAIRAGLFVVEGLFLALLGDSYRKLRRNLAVVSSRMQSYVTRAIKSEADVRAVRAVSRDTIWEWNLQTEEVQRTPSWQDRLSTSLPEREEFTSWMDRIHPDDRGAVIGKLTGAVEQGPDELRYSYRLRALNGSYLPVSDHVFVIRSETGETLRIIGRSAEATDLAPVPWDEHPLERMFAECPAAMVVMDRDLRFVQANAAAHILLRLSERRVPEPKLSAFVDPLSRSFVARRFAPLFQRDRLTISFEHTLIRRTGDSFHARILGAAVYEFQSHGTGCLLTIEEIAASRVKGGFIVTAGDRGL